MSKGSEQTWKIRSWIWCPGGLSRGCRRQGPRLDCVVWRTRRLARGGEAEEKAGAVVTGVRGVWLWGAQACLPPPWE